LLISGSGGADTGVRDALDRARGFLVFGSVFRLGAGDLSCVSDSWIASVDCTAGPRLVEEVIYFREEFGTHDWILEGMTGLAGIYLDSGSIRMGCRGRLFVLMIKDMGNL